MNNTKHFLSYSLLINFCLGLTTLWSCQKEESVNLPVISTSSITEITAISAKTGGIIASNGGATITDCGIVWSINENPTVETNQGITSIGVGTGSFTANLTNLTPNTTYYVRAYATNSKGTGYGNQQNFSTQDGVIAITTTSASKISNTSAQSGGNITTDGGAPITSRGLVWSTSQNPTVETNQGMISVGVGVGNFTANLTNLTPNSTYYVRTYAINKAGTNYGNQVNFTTFLFADGTQGTLIYNGYTYQTVYIGGREWMAENLRTTKYRDGSDIPTGYSDSQWGSITTGAYAIYPYNYLSGFSSDYEVVNAYGVLYNWYAVTDSKNLCPTGWHVPTNTEWTSLINYVSSINATNVGDQLKSCRQVSSPLFGNCATSVHPRWDSNGMHWGTNIYNFSALPSGFRHKDGSYGTIGYSGHWWTSTENSSTDAKRFYLYNDYGNFDGYFLEKNFGISIRCIKDN